MEVNQLHQLFQYECNANGLIFNDLLTMWLNGSFLLLCGAFWSIIMIANLTINKITCLNSNKIMSEAYEGFTITYPTTDYPPLM